MTLETLCEKEVQVMSFIGFYAKHVSRSGIHLKLAAAVYSDGTVRV